MDTGLGAEPAGLSHRAVSVLLRVERVVRGQPEVSEWGGKSRGAAVQELNLVGPFTKPQRQRLAGPGKAHAPQASQTTQDPVGHPRACFQTFW